MQRLIRFLQSWIRLRSIALAIWVDQYDNYKTKH